MIFDFDGTLADSLGASIEAFRAVAPRFRLRLPADLAAARHVPTRELLRQMGVRFWQLPRLIRAFHEAVAGTAPSLRLVDGLPAVLAELAARGHRLGVLSSNREDNIRACLRANGAEGLFAFVVGRPTLFGKGSALRRILRAERLDPAGVVYVGDEGRDVEAARRAGVAAAAVTWGFQAEELLRASGPDHVVREPRGLLELG
jgi:phosphoglycolate phosphatase